MITTTQSRRIRLARLLAPYTVRDKRAAWRLIHASRAQVPKAHQKTRLPKIQRFWSEDQPLNARSERQS